MTIFYIDYEGGNDANSGSSFANRWKTIPGGATAARIGPGDVIRIMSSLDETLVGNATWTNLSKTITLASAVTTNITTCESAWTASTNVTATAPSGGKEGTKYANITIAGAFTTGMCAYFATGTLDLSAYQQVSFWFQASANVAASTLSLRLCTDTAGATPVHTIAIPAIQDNSSWMPITVDLGSNMNSAIQSIAIYQDTDISGVTLLFDNIIACKASSSADSLTLTSLLGKVWNLSWVASTTYASNDIRIPTQPNRNGYRYKVTAGGGGAAGSTEPTWPNEIGVTITDGALTWTCEGLEDTWYGIQSINGTTVKLDNSTGTSSSSGRGYSGVTETVSTYKRETLKIAVNSIQSIKDSGTASSYITFSGGWNRTDMSTQTGETWFDGQDGSDGANPLIYMNGQSYVALININSVRGYRNIHDDGYYNTFKNCHCNNSSVAGFYDRTGYRIANSVQGVIANNGTNGVDFAPGSSPRTGFSYIAITTNNNVSASAGFQDNATYCRPRIKDIVSKNNTNYGFSFQSAPCGEPYTVGAVTSDNSPSSCFVLGETVFINSNFSETNAFTGFNQGRDKYAWSQKHQQTAGNHLGVTDGGTIQSATDQRHTGSGISWKFKPTQTYRNFQYPLSLSVAKIACAANTSVTVKIWCYRDNTNIVGNLVLKGGQLGGLPNDISVSCTPTINTWVQSGSLTFTPTETGVVEIFFQVYDGVGTTNSFWIDDISFS